MAAEPLQALHYKRSHFATQLPVDYLYSPSHAWIAKEPDDSWRVGLTKFATRMLGETVDHGLQVQVGDPVRSGQIIGWIEGFKAISDIYCIAEGTFGGGNPTLKEKIDLVHQDPYGAGWLYLVNGQPDARCVDVHAYRQILDKTIDKILEKQANQAIE
jgi:glycine cleavage system H protein